VDAPVPLIVCALLAAAVLVAPGARLRGVSALLALALTPVLLLAHVADTPQLDPLRSRPLLAAGAGVAALALVGALAVLVHRRPAVLPVATVAALPFRVPIASGGTTANLLVPLYLVIAAGGLAYAVPRALGRVADDDDRPGGVEWALAVTLILYTIQAAYSSDFDHALEQVVFFYVPFTILFAVLVRVRFTRRLVTTCVAVLAAIALVLAGIGFVEYATRSLLLNPKVITSNAFESYFRVNSLFFDPNIYGRFLAVVALAVTGVLLWTHRTRDAVVAALVLAVLWAALVLTFSQSSFAALLAGLAVLGGLRFGARRAVAATGAVALVGLAVVLLASGLIRLQLSSDSSVDSATSGRANLIAGGARLFAERPLEGYGSAAFAREYRRAEHVSAQKATSASHTIPITVAAEQGVGGLLVYLALLGFGLARLLRGARASVARAVVAAAFVALVVHTMLYAAFLEDPLSWALLGVGTALTRRP
jgi:O-antigen ligase